MLQSGFVLETLWRTRRRFLNPSRECIRAKSTKYLLANRLGPCPCYLMPPTVFLNAHGHHDNDLPCPYRLVLSTLLPCLSSGIDDSVNGLVNRSIPLWKQSGNSTPQLMHDQFQRSVVVNSNSEA